MNILPRNKQVEVIGALCEGVGQRAVARLTDTDRKTVARLALAIGHGAAELHDRMMVFDAMLPIGRWIRLAARSGCP